MIVEFRTTYPWRQLHSDTGEVEVLQNRRVTGLYVCSGWRWSIRITWNSYPEWVWANRIYKNASSADAGEIYGATVNCRNIILRVGHVSVSLNHRWVVK